MSLATVTTIGFEELLKHDNTSLFEFITLPDGYDRDTLINRILLRSGEFEVIYANPYFMRDAITTFFKSYYRTFEKWIKVYTADYDPLENYNRTEEWTDKADNTTTSGIESGGNTKNSVSAYDSSTFKPSDDVESHSTSNQTDVLDGLTTHKGHLFGNIGVTTSQQMAQEEYKIALFNIYEQIADLFIKEFCIPVY